MDTRYDRSQEVIKNHVLISMGAGLVPIPILDIAAVTAVQIDMLKQLARVYDVSFSENSGKGILSALTGSTLARVGASMVKAIPGIGTLFGGLSMAIMSGASTYAVGQVFQQHFSAGGDFSDFDPLKARDNYEEELRKGKEKAAQWKSEKDRYAKTDDPNDEILRQLAQIGELKEKGILSEEEFQKMKERLMEKMQ
ncbi:MAG TPA: DUF697 domain-containing protein [Flavilitoribacter sp.]|nr:DUF697 domain-containing protein [Flavilitoribacter sp.]HMQ87212.1 DUF697 domain-containing protein [Flavilitoribacter sp.]